MPAMLNPDFPESAPCAPPVYSRTYARRLPMGGRETWEQTNQRTIEGLTQVGNLTDDEIQLLDFYQRNLITLTSGRWLWVGGTEWVRKPENFFGAYNCTSAPMSDLKFFGLLMDLAMMGCGTGAVLEPKFIQKLPPVTTEIHLKVLNNIGHLPPKDRSEQTHKTLAGKKLTIWTGDSRQGWVESYMALLNLATSGMEGPVYVVMDLSNVRPPGEKIKGFGGVANPEKLAQMYQGVVRILNGAVGRQLNSLECCLLIDEAAVTIVAGNVRRCLPEDALVHTDRGLVPIRDVQVGDRVQTPIGFRRVTNKFDQGIQDVYEVEVETDSVSPRATLGHRMAVLNDAKGSIAWKCLKELEAGDRLCHIETDIPVTVKGLGSYDSVQTYDIEVEEAHCFYCDGYLTHNSAGIRQFAEDDTLGRSAKKDLWQQDENGNWRIDPMRDALRMANHTLVYHRKPSLEELIDTVRQQYYSGEGAIQYAPEAIARANVDIVNTDEKRNSFFESYLAGDGESSLRYLYLEEHGSECPPDELEHRLTRYGLNPCAEIVGGIFGCNLSEIHLNQIDPLDFYTQESAFRAGGLSVAVLLHHTFVQEDYRKSREMDPIVGVSFTGLFDFFVNAFGVDWLRWWQAGRPDTWGGTVPYVPLGEGVSPGSEEYLNLAEFYKIREAEYLDRWRKVAEKSVQNYCFRNNLKTPNRCTTVQPAGCGSRELLRIFDQGLIYADEVMEDGEGEVKDIGLTVRGGIPAATGIANQPLHLMKVTLANKRVLRLTPNHRLSVEGKWVRADELLPGVSIDHQFGEYRSNTEALLLPIDLTAHTKYNPSLPFGEFRKGYVVNIRLPDQTSPELGYIIGAIFGNGSCSQGRNRHRIRITHQRLSVIEKIQGISQELFRLPGKISHPTPQVHEICFDSSLLHGWMTLNKISKTSSSKKLNRIPLAIRMGSRETILGFFAGLLDTDGCVREGGRTSIESASEEFVRNLQQIGEAVGLCFSISHNTKGSNFQGEKNIWSLSLIRRHSQSEAIDWLNANSLKLKDRPIPPCAPSQSASKTSPYTVVSVEPESDPDYSFDFAIDGVDDDDSWYWQGALKSHNTKSLLSGASPGWHPPKAARFIRRITFRRDDPVALACLDYGYPIVPAQSCKDENGNLLAKDQYLDPRATEWLVEIPTAATWADLPGVDEIDISQFSATAQFDFFMQVQKHYTRHNCFSRDTRFMTDKGIRSFDDFVEGQKVIVLNLHSDWVPATIVKTGDIRPMLQITLKEEKSGRTKKIVSTHCHRFVAYDVRRPRPEQEVVVAKDLAVWHRLAYNTTFLVTATDKQKYDDSYLSWQVIDVRESEPEEGWCVMEPLTNHFTLEDNILVMNTSATIELREPEIEPLAQAIHEAIQNDEGYISAALLARFDDLETFPRLPFEPIDKATYDLLVAEVKARRKTDDFHEALARYDAQAEESFEAGPTACDSETCQLPR